MTELHDWSVVGISPNGYAEPCQHLCGRRPDGTLVRTSRIVTIDGNIITTASGSQYRLLQPNPSYVEWCQLNNYHIPTEQEPIKCIS